MRETTLYERLLGIERPWRVHDVRLALEQGDVEVGVEFVGETLVCPACGAVRSGPRNLDSGLSEISIVFQAAVPKLVASKYTTSGVRRPSEL